jgi:hypothetical protein
MLITRILSSDTAYVAGEEMGLDKNNSNGK